MPSPRIVLVFEKLLRQRARWSAIVDAWRAKDDPPSQRADVLTYCRDELDFIIRQIGRRMTSDELEEAFSIAESKSDQRQQKYLPAPASIVAKDQPPAV